jgi:HK97 gp10 family phage protein
MAVSLLGMEKLVKAFGRVKVELEAASDPAARAGAKVVAGKISPPVASGATAGSVFSAGTDHGAAEAGVATPYARYPELGTRYQRAQHFLRSAADDSHGGIVAVMVPIFRSAIR